MNDPSQEDTYQQAIDGTIIIPVKPSSQSPSPQKHKKKGSGHRRKKNKGGYMQHESSIQDHPSGFEGEDSKEIERHSEGKMKGADEETLGQIEESGLTQPY